MLQAVMGRPTPPASYAGGPGDIIATWWAWYGLRGFSIAAASGTTKSVRVRRDSDNAETDVVILTTGNLDIASATSFAAGANLFVTTWYDQSGNTRDITQATAGLQPQLMLSSGPSSGQPHVKFASKVLSRASAMTAAQPIAMEIVSIRTSTFTAYNFLMYLPTNNVSIRYHTSANQWSAFAGAEVPETCSDSTWHCLQSLFSGGASHMQLDATADFTVSLGTNGASSSTLFVGAADATGATLPLNGSIYECGLLTSATTSPNRNSISTQVHAFAGF